MLAGPISHTPRRIATQASLMPTIWNSSTWGRNLSGSLNCGNLIYFCRVTCVYLACKIEEFYVTINDFVHNVRGDKKKAAEIILNNELQLTQELQFHLIIHQPFRPVEGLLIDIKTRFPQLRDPERLRPHVEEFLERVNLTDAIILYTPGQVSLLLKFKYF
ncbi:cyclin-H-like [Penaeus indicus]|uniref:cyclin-H-like n=1 Tax=Penaeus indicus TaxID=29960 RepID=UPI00300C64DB